MSKLIETDWGYVSFDTNELSVISIKPDPPKVRMASPANEDGGLSLGAFSWNVLRSDGRQIETVLFQGKRDERFRHLPITNPRALASEFTIHMNNGGDQDANMVRILEARHDGIRFDVPVIFVT